MKQKEHMVFIRSFGESIYTRKTKIDESAEDQSNLFKHSTIW